MNKVYKSKYFFLTVLLTVQSALAFAQDIDLFQLPNGVGEQNRQAIETKLMRDSCLGNARTCSALGGYKGHQDFANQLVISIQDDEVHFVGNLWTNSWQDWGNDWSAYGGIGPKNWGYDVQKPHHSAKYGFFPVSFNHTMEFKDGKWNLKKPEVLSKRIWFLGSLPPFTSVYVQTQELFDIISPSLDSIPGLAQ